MKTWRGRPATNPNGSDNLLAGVWALVSCKYSLFGVQRGFVGALPLVLRPQMLPKAETRNLTTSQTLREIADDYRHLAADTHGKADDLRARNYQWLLKLVDKITAKHTAAKN